eukprot:9406877-Prorocentrum_lima.AAC.1
MRLARGWRCNRWSRAWFFCSLTTDADCSAGGPTRSANQPERTCRRSRGRQDPVKMREEVRGQPRGPKTI